MDTEGVKDPDLIPQRSPRAPLTSVFVEESLQSGHNDILTTEVAGF